MKTTKMMGLKKSLAGLLGSTALTGGSEIITENKLLISTPNFQKFNDAYGSDIPLGMAWYFIPRFAGFSKKVSLITSISSGIGFELAQYSNLISGTADIWDIAAYTTGILVAFGIDKAIEKNSDKKV